MILDNEVQRQFLLEMFKQVNFPGQTLEVAYAVKQAVSAATIDALRAQFQQTTPPAPLSSQELARASD